MSSKRSLVTRGFTIVEVLFVLAIAGVIFMIVFQAVPTLQRNSRNNVRKQDVQAILGAVSHWELNNSANLPSSPANNFLQYTNLTYYTKSTIQYRSTPSVGIGVYTYGDAAAAPVTAGPVTSINVVQIYNYEKCSTNNSGTSTSAGAGYGDVVALYAIESGRSATSAQCQQL